MSHFVVYLVADSPESVEELLAPFNENLECSPWRDMLPTEPREHSFTTWALSNGLKDDVNLTWGSVIDFINQGHVKECGKNFPENGETCEDCGEQAILLNDEGKPYQVVNYNPEGHWDWWVIGGRWAGLLPLNEKGKASKEPIRAWHTDTFVDTPANAEGLCDGAPLKLLDIKGRRVSFIKEAQKRWKVWQEAVLGLPTPRPFREFYALSERDRVNYPTQGARYEYDHQPALVKARALGLATGMFGDIVEDFDMTEEDYLLCAEVNAFSGYAFVTHEGDWLAPGEISMLTFESSTTQSRAAYSRRVKEYFDSLSEDMWLIAVDCHA
jgi:hypothetical protein